MTKLVKHCALTKINSVTVRTELPRSRMSNICSSPEYAVSVWKIQYPLSVYLKGTMTNGRFRLIPRTGLEPTVRMDICESSVFYQIYNKNDLHFSDNWIKVIYSSSLQLFDQHLVVPEQCGRWLENPVSIVRMSQEGNTDKR
jgi:hypothetical protein